MARVELDVFLEGIEDPVERLTGGDDLAMAFPLADAAARAQACSR